MDHAGEASPIVRRLAVVLIFAVGAIYVAARFWRLTDSCLWFDEIFSVHAAEQPWSDLLSFVALDLIHPPLFYLLLKLWISIGGESIFWLRLLAVTFSCIAIAPFILLCRELKQSVWVTTLALFFLAVNGSLIKYAHEVRMYSLLMCLSLFSMWLFARYFNQGKGLVWLLIVNVLVVYSHYFGWLLISAEAAAVLILQRSRWRQIAAMFGVVFASFVPWISAVSSAAAAGSELSENIGWIPRPGLLEIVTFVFDLIEPFYYQAISITEPASIYRVSIPILLILLVACILYSASWKDRSSAEKRSAYLLSIFAGVPITVAFIGSWLIPYSVWGTRHLIIAFVPISLLLARTLTLSRRALRVFLLTLILLFTGYSLVLQLTRSIPNYSWCGFSDLAGRIDADGRGPVYVFEDLAAYHLWFAFRINPDEKMRGRVINTDAYAGMKEAQAYFIPRGIDDEFLSRGHLPSKGGHFWIVYRAPVFDVTKPPLDRLIADGYKVVKKESIKGDDWDAFAVLVEDLEK